MNVIRIIRPGLEKLIQNKWFRLFLQVFILILCLIYLANNLRSISSAQIEFHIDLFYLASSIVITILTVFLGAIGFWLSLKSLFMKVSWMEAINIHLQSNLAKYIPGYAWQLIGKTYLTRQTGASIKTVGFAMTIELVQHMLAGICVAVISFPNIIIVNLKIYETMIRILPLVQLLAILICTLFPLCIAWIVKKSRILSPTMSFNITIFYGAVISMLVSWILFGCSFWLLGKALFPIDITKIQLFVFTLAASFLIGLVIIIIPASIGVRESIMVWFLGPIIGEPEAVIIAALARITVTLGELISAYASKLVWRGGNNPKVLEPKKNTDNHQ